MKVKKQLVLFISRQWVLFEILSQGFSPLGIQALQLAVGDSLGSLLELFL